MTLRHILCLSGLLGPLWALGQAYFQQAVDYVINVRLDDRSHVLHAEETFTYHNNSATTLDTMWIHLWPNAYRDRTTALCEQLDGHGELDLHFATEEERGWIDSLDFKADDVTVAWGYHAQHADIGWIKLNAPLTPGQRVRISTPFRVKIPDGKFSRLGHTGQAYYITQWYPKPAVFDAQGWHAMPYFTQGEFYSEFGSFDVSITLPANYIVGATGVLQNERETAWMDSLSTTPYKVDQYLEDIASISRYKTIPSSANTKTLRFTQDRVHDFAWFSNKRFIVRKSEVALLKSGRTVKTWALFTPKNAKLWEDAVSYVNESVRFYSEWVGDYPYDACTAVDGTISAGGGMEYPMITIIGDTGDKQSLDNVITHEVGHNWFFGILGSNERDHAWMDEGMNSFVELQYMRARYPGNRLTIGGLEFLSDILGDLPDGHRMQNEGMYRLNARRNLDQPLNLTSADYTSTNYGCMVYAKSALVFDHLMAYIGDDSMKRCLNAYYDDWRFKHPQPQDMRKVFERESGHNLNWVFDGLIGTGEKFDFKAVRLLPQDVDQMPIPTLISDYESGVPVPITGYCGNDSLGTMWTMAQPRWNTFPDQLPWGKADRFHIDAGNRTLDIDRRNNSVRSHGLFRRCAPLQFKWLLGVEQNDKRTVYYTPLPAWNGNDGWQLGLAAYNTTFPSQRTEWVVAPMYGLASERWGGAARIEHHFDRMRSRMFQNITLGVSGRSASEFRDHDVVAWYDKVSPYVHLDLKRDPLNKPWQHRITWRGVYLNNASRSRTRDGIEVDRSYEDYYMELQYRAEDKSKLHRSLILPTVTHNTGFLRASLELRQAFALNDHNDEIRFRAFVGSFLWKRDDRLYNGLHAWGLSWGTEDMLYDHAYLERNARDHFTQRQYNTQQGAFKTPFLQGGSDSWIAALNMEIDVPVPLPLALFGSVGVVPITVIDRYGPKESSAAYFEAGIGVTAVRDVLEIWFPLVVSNRIADEEKFLDRAVTDRIRFIFAFDKLDPTKAVRNIKP
ncbi:MAG: M1 family metallopeptidase [Flavobacteriales bacterium]|nr:M1 family metallopeptidase [Flavobacteriales bacterium]